MERKSVLFQLFRERADRAFLHAKIRHYKVLQVAFWNEQRAPTLPTGNKSDNK
jgi:hypothetical protein